MAVNRWQKFKQDIQSSNAKVMADHRKRTTNIKEDVKQDKTKGNKFMLILGGTALSLPLLAIGIALFIMAGLLFWDAIFGL